MDTQNYTTSFLVDQSPAEAFDAINNVTAWWTENLDGNTKNTGDEFLVQFWDVHSSRQKLTEVVPGKKVIWLVTESKLTFIADESEWTGNQIVFEIAKIGTQTQVTFTQIGLVPQIECYNDCSNAWGGYIQGSLKSLIATGKGAPTLKETKD